MSDSTLGLVVSHQLAVEVVIASALGFGLSYKFAPLIPRAVKVLSSASATSLIFYREYDKGMFHHGSTIPLLCVQLVASSIINTCFLTIYSCYSRFTTGSFIGVTQLIKGVGQLTFINVSTIAFTLWFSEPAILVMRARREKIRNEQLNLAIKNGCSDAVILTILDKCRRITNENLVLAIEKDLSDAVILTILDKYWKITNEDLNLSIRKGCSDAVSLAIIEKLREITNENLDLSIENGCSDAVLLLLIERILYLNRFTLLLAIEKDRSDAVLLLLIEKCGFLQDLTLNLAIEKGRSEAVLLPLIEKYGGVHLAILERYIENDFSELVIEKMLDLSPLKSTIQNVYSVMKSYRKKYEVDLMLLRCTERKVHREEWGVFLKWSWKIEEFTNRFQFDAIKLTEADYFKFNSQRYQNFGEDLEELPHDAFEHIFEYLSIYGKYKALFVSRYWRRAATRLMQREYVALQAVPWNDALRFLEATRFDEVDNFVTI
ncbi:MAG: hypothetical protein K1060chlam2_00131 [Chlamydiae bacterium]|nr:hypothetical protein [Chlamydiota bacterium]